MGIKTERHAITIAGARSGKGACQIIPNLLRWPDNSLTIDPSAENVAATWEKLEKAGKRVVLLDPFHAAERYGVPARLRASVNLLDHIKPESMTVREDIRVIADGLVKRYKVEDGTWDNGAVSVLAGMIAYTAAQPDAADRTLANVRFLLTLPEETRAEVFADMQGQSGFGNLARAAAAICLSKSRKNQEFLGGALDHTEWLDSGPMAELLNASTFSLSELKHGNAAVFLVLPHEYINEHSRFLRLFVRTAIDAMTKGKGGRRCLFLLDEFFSLGTIDEIAKAAGALPKFGVHLWPFLQDLGQLQQMYGAKLSETFFGNSDASCFFGNSDALTLNYVSRALGTVTLDEIPKPPPTPSPSSSDWDQKRDALRHQQAMNEYHHAKSRLGSARATPEEVAAFVGRGDADKVARHMIVFTKLGAVLWARPAPYFDDKPPAAATLPEEPSRPAEPLRWEDICREQKRLFASGDDYDPLSFAPEVLAKVAFQDRYGSIATAIHLFGWKHFWILALPNVIAGWFLFEVDKSFTVTWYEYLIIPALTFIPMFLWLMWRAGERILYVQERDAKWRSEKLAEARERRKAAEKARDQAAKTSTVSMA